MEGKKKEAAKAGSDPASDLLSVLKTPFNGEPGGGGSMRRRE